MTRAVRRLAEGIYFGEGPRWHQGRLWFSDFYAHRICSVSLDGDLRTELELEGRPSGLGWMPDGSLLVVRMELRQVWRRWPDGLVRLPATCSPERQACRARLERPVEPVLRSP